MPVPAPPFGLLRGDGLAGAAAWNFFRSARVIIGCAVHDVERRA